MTVRRVLRLLSQPQPRDARHHACVDRQTYGAMKHFLMGFLLAPLLVLLGTPNWLIVAVLAIALLTIPALHLLWDREERRRSGLTDADRAAGRE